MLELENLTKQFDALVAVDSLNLRVAAGEILALLGPNGAGKTTTVRMLSAILKPSRGRARVAGYDIVTDALAVRQHVGVLTEAPGLYTRMSGREYLEFFGEVRGLSAAERRARIIELSERFRMSGALDRRLGEYSKGMAQKIALIRTLLHEPSVLLLDEPTSAMDPESARLVRDTILQLRSSHRAIVVCTHNLTEAEELADRIAIIRQGRIVAQGTIEQLRTQLLGPPVMEARFAAPSENGVVTLVSSLAPVVDAGADWVRFQTETPAETNPQVLRTLLGAGFEVAALSEVPRSLESIYLRVVAQGG